jgi:hypothetical protein
MALKALRGCFMPRREVISAATQALPNSESKERICLQEKAETSSFPIEVRFANSITGLSGATKDLDILHLTSKSPSIIFT